jgi:hypothetical protein
VLARMASVDATVGCMYWRLGTDCVLLGGGVGVIRRSVARPVVRSLGE